MSRKKTSPEEKKMEENKKSTKIANKKHAKNKINNQAKKLSDKMIIDIAATLPAGQGNAFVQLNIEHDKADEMVAAALAVRRGVRAKFKGIKCDMSVVNLVRKGRKMDPDDWMASKVTQALYEKQLGMKLSPDQEALVQDIEVKRENARAAMSVLNGGETGKEIGSGDSAIGHNSKANGTPEEKKVEPLPTLPERNESVGKGFRHPDAANTTH